MARLALGARDRRALAIGVLLVAPALGWRLVVQPYFEARAELSARVKEQRSLLTREMAIVGAVEHTSADLGLARQQFAARHARLLPRHEPLAATGALVAMVRDEARRRNVLLNAVEMRPAEPGGGGLVGVRIEVRGRSDLQGLLEWLAALETGPRLLRLDALTVANTDGRESLRVGAVIRGYVRSAQQAP